MKYSQIWQSPFCKTHELSYAEYFTDNLLSPALSEKTARRENWVFKNSIIVEIAPDNVFQSVITESTDTTISIALLQRHHEENIKVFLQGLGKMYNNGLQPQLANLYPTVQFPVSRGTPMISPSIKYIKHYIY